MIGTSVLFADVIRVLVMIEITFGIGFLAARLWKRRRSPWQYLSLMTIALSLYSLFTFFILISRYGTPLSWQAPFAGAAATLAFVAIVREGHKHPKKKEDGK